MANVEHVLDIWRVLRVPGIGRTEADVVQTAASPQRLLACCNHNECLASETYCYYAIFSIVNAIKLRTQLAIFHLQLFSNLVQAECHCFTSSVLSIDFVVNTPIQISRQCRD
jgi:hypothetical protein